MKRVRLAVNFPSDIWYHFYAFLPWPEVLRLMGLNQTLSHIARYRLRQKWTRIYEKLPKLCFQIRSRNEGRSSCGRKNHRCQSFRSVPLFVEYDRSRWKSDVSGYTHCSATGALCIPRYLSRSQLEEGCAGHLTHRIRLVPTCKNPPWLRKMSKIRMRKSDSIAETFPRIYRRMVRYIRDARRRGWYCDACSRWFRDHGERPTYDFIVLQSEYKKNVLFRKK